eukprot:Amastigsp_a679749_60.p2 type:complete len:180 gc:universal Amastigsp_a679749_60:958-419(-)
MVAALAECAMSDAVLRNVFDMYDSKLCCARDAFALAGTICMNSPSTRLAMTVESSSMTSTLRRRASASDARANRKSPPSTASLFPKTWLMETTERRWSAVSMTSSCTSDAVWIISVISARRRCDGSTKSADSALLPAAIESATAVGSTTRSGLCGCACAAARETRSTMVGRIFFPSRSK